MAASRESFNSRSLARPSWRCKVWETSANPSSNRRPVGSIEDAIVSVTGSTAGWLVIDAVETGVSTLYPLTNRNALARPISARSMSTDYD